MSSIESFVRVPKLSLLSLLRIYALSTRIAERTASNETIYNFVIVNVSFVKFLYKFSRIVNRVAIVVL